MRHSNIAHWLDTQYETLFRLRLDGRIERENDPDCSPGPRFWLAGCSERNLFGLRDDLQGDLAAQIEALAATEPPLTHSAPPKYLERYLSLLGNGDPAEYDHGLTYELPNAHPYPTKAQIIGSDSKDGDELLRSWASTGVPENLVELGFSQLADFWAPWCAVVVDGEVASIAFAARLSDTGAELGLVTSRAHRGQGYAAAATAGWSRLPSLRSRTLFYSTDRDNVSSQRVAARLGLLLLGTSLRIA